MVLDLQEIPPTGAELPTRSHVLVELLARRLIN